MLELCLHKIKFCGMVGILLSGRAYLKTGGTGMVWFFWPGQGHRLGMKLLFYCVLGLLLHGSLVLHDRQTSRGIG